MEIRRPSSATAAAAARPPRALALLAALLGLEALALVVYGVVQTVLSLTGAGRMPLASVLLMALLFIGYGIWLASSVRALYLRRLWPRALVLLTQVFLVVISLQMLSAWMWLVALDAVAAVVVLVLLFSSPVQRWLLSGQRPEAS